MIIIFIPTLRNNESNNKYRNKSILNNHLHTKIHDNVKTGKIGVFCIKQAKKLALGQTIKEYWRKINIDENTVGS